MNNLKTVFLFGLLTAVLVGIGWAIGGYAGMIGFLVIAGIMNFVGFWFSDKLALRMAGAREVTMQEEPRLHSTIEEVAAGARMPAMILIVVVLPAPLGPSSPTISPLRSVNERSCRTSVRS